jgi:hypothetical protein
MNKQKNILTGSVVRTPFGYGIVRKTESGLITVFLQDSKKLVHLNEFNVTEPHFLSTLKKQDLVVGQEVLTPDGQGVITEISDDDSLILVRINDGTWSYAGWFPAECLIVSPAKTLKVKLTYFRKSGKYYSNGKFDVPDDTPYFVIIEKVRKMQRDGKLPGLAQGYTNVLIYIRCPGHEHDHPRILV